MRKGFTALQAFHMYRSLAREVINNYGDRFAIWDIPKFVSESCNVSDNVRYRKLNWGHARDTALLAVVDFNYDMGPNYLKPISMTICKDYLDYLYEDELVGVLLHEIGHVMHGPKHGFRIMPHNPDWEMFVKELGGVHEQFFLPKDYKNIPERIIPRENVEWMLANTGEPFYSRV